MCELEGEKLIIDEDSHHGDGESTVPTQRDGGAGVVIDESTFRGPSRFTFPQLAHDMHTVTRRVAPSNSGFFERIFKDSEDPSNFPLRTRPDDPDSLTYIVRVLNLAFELEDKSIFESLRAQLLSTLDRAERLADTLALEAIQDDALSRVGGVCNMDT